MGKYSALQNDIFSVFNSPAWKAENVKTFPADFIAINAGNEYLRVNVIAGTIGINRRSVSGILIIDIFTPAGLGPKRANLIADKLDSYLENKSVSLSADATTQFGTSVLTPLGTDRDNPSLSRSSYEIPFNFFGVIK